jgi:two-component system response regulator YesN
MDNMDFLIVDDELPIREWLKLTVEKTLGTENRINCASNGSEALDLFLKHKPKIVITDIKMPVMDGIQLLRQIRLHEADTYVVMLTSYSDFNYVRNALSLKADEYVLKNEITSQTISEIMNRCIDKLNRKKQVYTVDLQIKRTLFFREIMSSGHTFSHQSEERLKELGITLQNRPIISIAVRIQDDAWNYEQNYKFLMPNDSYLENATCFNIDKQTFVVLANVKIDNIMLENYKDYVWREFVQKIRNMFVSWNCGVSEIMEDLSKLVQSTEQSLAALNQGFYTGEIFNCFQGAKPDNNQYATAISSISGEIVQCFLEKDLISVQKGVQNLLNTINEFRPNDIANVKKLCTDLLDRCISNCGNTNSDILAELEKDKNSMMETFSFGVFSTAMQQAFDKLFHLYSNDYKNDYVKEAIIYINHNYSKIRTIQDISKNLCINTEYFCRIFKNETGMTVNSYLTSLRINKAEKLLQKTNNSVNEIASKVGYQNPNYFSRLFKKIKGINPSEIRSC